MDLRDRMEIYIPVVAEVKSIPLWHLPDSVSRRIGLPVSVSDSNGFKELKDCPECIWISPAVIRRKGQKQTIHTENEVKENMASLLDRKTQSGSGSFRMSFVSSNRTAYRVLKDTMPGKTVAAHASYASQLRQGSSPQSQDAVIIYNGQIYLSIRKPNRSQSQRDTRKPQPAPQSGAPSTSDSSSKIQKKDVLNDNRPKKKRITSKVKHSENENSVTQTVRDVSSSVTACSAPQSAVSLHGVDGNCHEDALEQASEEVQESDWFQPHEELTSNGDGECEIQDLSSEEAESIDHISEMDRNIECDFQALNHEEKIAKMKAKFREKTAAVSSLNSS